MSRAMRRSLRVGPQRQIGVGRRQAGSVLVAAALLVGVAGGAAVGAHGLTEPRVALWFLLAITVGEIAQIALPRDRGAAPFGTAAALGYALLVGYGSLGEVDDTAAQVVAVTATGVLLGAVPHLAAGRAVRLDEMARRVLIVGVAAVTFRLLIDGPLGPVLVANPPRLAGAMLVAIALTFLVDAALAALVRAGDTRAPYVPTLRDELRAHIGLGVATGATGMLIALTAETMGGWALPVFAVPMLLTQYAFRRYAAIRATYLQTIRALSRVTEVAGYTETGHARRVAALSAAVGRDLGMSEADLLDLEYAALVHDLGQLSLTEPIPGGSTVMATSADQVRIAGLGADVLRQTGVLDDVATIVANHPQPYRQVHQRDDESVPLGSRIVKVVNAYDDLVGDEPAPERRLHALEQLRLGMAYDYDPVVVESLSRVSGRITRTDS